MESIFRCGVIYMERALSIDISSQCGVVINWFQANNVKEYKVVDGQSILGSTKKIFTKIRVTRKFSLQEVVERQTLLLILTDCVN